MYNEVENELEFKLHAYPFVRGKLVNERKALDFKSIYVQSFFLWFLILVAIELFIVCKQHYCFIHNQIKIEYICQFWGVVFLGMLSYCVQGRVDMVVGYEEG